MSSFGQVEVMTPIMFGPFSQKGRHNVWLNLLENCRSGFVGGGHVCIQRRTLVCGIHLCPRQMQLGRVQGCSCPRGPRNSGAPACELRESKVHSLMAGAGHQGWGHVHHLSGLRSSASRLTSFFQGSRTPLTQMSFHLNTREQST